MHINNLQINQVKKSLYLSRNLHNDIFVREMN